MDLFNAVPPPPPSAKSKPVKQFHLCFDGKDYEVTYLRSVDDHETKKELGKAQVARVLRHLAEEIEKS